MCLLGALFVCCQLIDYIHNTLCVSHTFICSFFQINANPQASDTIATTIKRDSNGAPGFRFVKWINQNINQCPNNSSIAGGRGDTQPFRMDDPTGVYVSWITDHGPAYDKLTVGDKVLSVRI
jgi:hypothetical protein